MAVAVFHARALEWGYAGVLETTVLQGDRREPGQNSGCDVG